MAAAKLAGLTEVPVLITSYDDAEAMTVALVENLQRENLNPLEEAEALFALKEAHSLSQEDLASKLGKVVLLWQILSDSFNCRNLPEMRLEQGRSVPDMPEPCWLLEMKMLNAICSKLF